MHIGFELYKSNINPFIESAFIGDENLRCGFYLSNPNKLMNMKFCKKKAKIREK